MSGKKGLIIAAPSSGSGKTTVTLALLRALSNAGYNVRAAKCGPDYIDPVFLEKASGRPALNLDPFAMDRDAVRRLVDGHVQEGETLVIEGVMGLFDGGPNGAGSTADLAQALDLPIILVLNAQGSSQSVAAIARGFKSHTPSIKIAGVILNNVGSQRHLSLIKESWISDLPPILGIFMRNSALHLPSRHLGLVQAEEHEDLEKFVELAAESVSQLTPLDPLLERAHPIPESSGAAPSLFPPLGNHIAIARDRAFRFSYNHLLDSWRSAGATLSFFSPLEGSRPERAADALFLPGGYPELHSEAIAASPAFLKDLRDCASRGVKIYGECGGYMVLGKALIDKKGHRHQMAGLLPVVTSFENPKRHLGYRIFTGIDAGPLPGVYCGHEFHFSCVVEEQDHGRLFSARDLYSAEPKAIGHVRGSVFGSYGHIIAQQAGS